MSSPGTPSRCVAILPARIGSTRLPRKALLAETGTALVVHAARNVARAGTVTRVVVATDSEDVARVCRDASLEVLMTSPEHPSGTDRVAEAAARLGGTGAWDVVLNVQGDEPDVDPQDLERLVRAFQDPEVEVATLAAEIADEAELRAPSAVKVVCDRAGNALYFSRSAIPSREHARPGGAPVAARRHVGVYAFRPDAILQFAALAEGDLERTESLEQLRWLEAGRRIRVVQARHVPRGIDTRQDYDDFVARLRRGTFEGSSSR